MASGERTTSTIRAARARATRPGRLVLHVLDQPEAPAGGGAHELTRASVKVGRSDLAGLQLHHDSISKLHFELQILPTSGVRLRDLGSKNGTWFQGRRIESLVLEPGDVFVAGECSLRLEAIAEIEVEVLEAERLGLLVGRSLAMRELFAELETLAPTPLDVLISGETGTGKELAARTLHARSGRGGPFVVLDCAALSTSLADSTLFGVRKGAFTGADRDHPGAFEAAAGGTVFLDEIGELPLDLQRKLLGVLERRSVSRLGEPAKERPIDVRVVAATHRDLRELAAAGQFREDLYYRLARACVHLVPLRERDGDVALLADRFVAACCEAYGLEVELGEDARARLRREPWPGNVRQLRNVIERACHVRRTGTIHADDLRLGASASSGGPRVGPVAAAIAAASSYAALHEALDRLALPLGLERHGHKLAPLARELEISRDRLRRRLRELDLYASDAG